MGVQGLGLNQVLQAIMVFFDRVSRRLAPWLYVASGFLPRFIIVLWCLPPAFRG